VALVAFDAASGKGASRSFRPTLMKIADLEFFLLRPTAAGLELGASSEPVERTLLVRVATANGEEGWGEARTAWRANELSARRDSALPTLAGHNVADVEELLAADGLAPPGMRAAIEMACWDLIGRAARQPLCRLWGGEYRPHVPVALRLPPATPERAAQLAHDLTERGFFHQIVVAAGDIEQDRAVVKEVRQATADRVKLRLDGAGRFAPEAARELCRHLEDEDLEFFLDPLATGLDGLTALARQTAVPLAVSSSIRAPADVIAVARAGMAPHVVIDIALVGGLWPARKCAIVAAAAHVPASLRGAVGLGVGLAGVIQIAAASPHLALAHECASFQLYEDVLRQSPSIVDGTIALPLGPGLGVDVDRLRLEAHQMT